MRDIPLQDVKRTRQARASIARGLALLGAVSALSCSGDGPYDPTGPERPLTALEVTPTVADLCAPGNKVQLTLVARDHAGAAIPGATGTYSSSAPAVAKVNSSGVVTAGAPGTAVITATSTRHGITLKASMNVTVHETPAEYSEIAGVYDLNTLQTVSQWGMQGSIEIAVITIQHSRGTPLFAGTFADFSLFYYPDDQSPRNIPFSGTVSGSIDCVGGVVIELRTDELPKKDYLWSGKGTLTSGQIAGEYSEAPGEGGTFTAVRRQVE